MPEMIAHIGDGPSVLVRSTDPVSTPLHVALLSLSSLPSRCRIVSDPLVNGGPRGERDIRSNRGAGRREGEETEGETTSECVSPRRRDVAVALARPRGVFMVAAIFSAYRQTRGPPPPAREESPRTRATAIRASSRRGRIRGGGPPTGTFLRRRRRELLAGMPAERDDHFAARFPRRRSIHGMGGGGGQSGLINRGLIAPPYSPVSEISARPKRGRFEIRGVRGC